MAKADDYPIPTTALDKEVARLALLHARQLVAEGTSQQEAAMLATKGAWKEWRGWVTAHLSTV